MALLSAIRGRGTDNFANAFRLRMRRLLQTPVILFGNDLWLFVMVRLSAPPAIIEFGNFSILPHRRQFLTDGQPTRLGGRAFDLLLALIEAPGAVVGKYELLSRIWPGQIVEENRLQ